MRSRQDQADKLARLDGLAASPAAQLSLALELLETDTTLAVTQAALRVIAENPKPNARPGLLRRYAFCDANGTRRDSGGYVRSQILQALRRLARPDDIPLLERAASTYEFTMPGAEVCWSLRADALIALNELDPNLASYHCVRLLTDEFTSRMSGEPAVTAARILASQSQVLPLYQCVITNSARASEVTSEALKNLIGIPDTLLPPIVEKFRESTDEIALVGLFDLILEHAEGSRYDDFVVEFLRTTPLHDVHRYVVTTIVAKRKEALRAHLLELADKERERRRLENLRDALTLLKGDPAAEAAVRRIEAKLR